VALSREEVVQWEGIRAVLVEKPFAAPRLDQVAKQLSLKPPQLKTLMKKLAKMGEVYAVSEDRYFVAPAVRELAAIMAEEIAANPEGVAAARLRDRIGIGRTVVIEILEFFNRIGYTRRVKDAHKMRDAKMFESGR
jgi:selenocysteine-specific elongation factor